VILESDGSVGRTLRELAGEGRWLVREPRSADAALAFARERRPGVLVVQVEPGGEKAESFALIADAHRLCPDVPVVAVTDAKLSDPDRVAWTAVLMDLGARYVLVPPLSKPVLEDVVSGLMAASVRRVVGGEVPEPRAKSAEDILDLADDGSDE
jgi:hypothetical protein